MDVNAYSAITRHYPMTRSDQVSVDAASDPESDETVISHAEGTRPLLRVDKERAQQSAEELNRFLVSRRIRLRFTLLLSEGAVLIQVQDTSTGEVIRELTIATFLRALQGAGQAQGFFLNEVA